MRQIDGSLFDKSPQAFCVVRGNKDRKKSKYEFKFVYFNEAFIELAGMGKKKLMNQSIHHIFTKDNGKWIQFFYDAAYNEKTRKTKDMLEGSGRCQNIVCFPIRIGYCGCILKDCNDIFQLFYGNLFLVHLYVDLDRDVFFCMYLDEALPVDIPKKGCFSELPGIITKYIVYPDDQEAFCRTLEKEYICERLNGEKQKKSSNSFSVNFRSMQAGEIKTCQMFFLNEGQEVGRQAHYVHVFFQNIDVERRVPQEIRKKETEGLDCTAKRKKEPVKISESGTVESELDAFMAKDFTGKRILLAEDNEVNREILTGILAATGADVKEVENGKAAVKSIRDASVGFYDIIFMDINMPFMNGYEAAKAIRELETEDGERIPIIAMTANAFEEDVIAARNAGMDGHIAKPIDFKEMGRILEKWLGTESIATELR